MKSLTNNILKYTLILLLALLLDWWLFFISPFNIPEFIPYTPIKINGIILGAIFITILIIAQKEILKIAPSSSITKLVLIGTTIIFIAELFFQCIRSFASTSNLIYDFFSGVINITIANVFFSFFVAFQLKTKRTKKLLIYIIVFIILFNILLRLFPSIQG